jgi:hypothetical protein
MDIDEMDDPFSMAEIPNATDRLSPITGLPFSISSPKTAQLFNVFHPSDPISYRLEPLISPAMSSLKPQLLPYTKKGIFGTVAPQGLTGIGAKVGQSVTQGVSGLWSSLSAGIANNLLNRSLGLSSEEVAKMNASGVAANELGEKASQRKRQLAEASANGQEAGDSGATLIDDDLETLYSKFQKRRRDISRDEAEESEKDWALEERKSQKLRREELKVRALNRNGRVDYSIQE